MIDTPTGYQFGPAAQDMLMPMNVLIPPTGHIGRVGATMARLRPDHSLVGQRFLEVFSINRPRKIVTSFAHLQSIVGSNLRLQFREGAPIAMKGVIAEESGTGCLLVNLSFGFHLIDAVAEYNLTNGDFALTDLAIEILYLIEAKTAVMEGARKLNLRLHGARTAAEIQALRDPLTGLKNRRGMNQVLERLSKSGVPFGLMHLDLDYFKAVNDSLGHAAGDVVLQAAAAVLLKETRDCDTVARVGGDEFIVIFEALVDKKRLHKIGNRIVKQLEAPLDIDGKVCRISGSIGFTTSDFYATPKLDQLLSDADAALYTSKNKGRARATMVTKKLLADTTRMRGARFETGSPVQIN